MTAPVISTSLYPHPMYDILGLFSSCKASTLLWQICCQASKGLCHDPIAILSVLVYCHDPIAILSVLVYCHDPMAILSVLVYCHDPMAILSVLVYCHDPMAILMVSLYKPQLRSNPAR